MGFSYSILLAFGLQIYLKPFLLTHGYSFQLSQFQSIPFDRGKLSKSCCDRMNQWLDLGTNRFKEGGDDTATPRAHFWTSSLSIACKSMQAEIVQFLFVELRLARFQLTRAQVSSIELNLATIQLIYFIG